MCMEAEYSCCAENACRFEKFKKNVHGLVVWLFFSRQDGRTHFNLIRFFTTHFWWSTGRRVICIRLWLITCSEKPEFRHWKSGCVAGFESGLCDNVGQLAPKIWQVLGKLRPQGLRLVQKCIFVRLYCNVLYLQFDLSQKCSVWTWNSYCC